jgi:hypothetical protein
MLRESVRSRLVPIILDNPFEKVTVDGQIPVTVRIKSLSWYRTKCIYVGTIVGADENYLLNQRVIGSLKAWYEQHKQKVVDAGINLSEPEKYYLSEPWNIEEPTTAHELTASMQA